MKEELEIEELVKRAKEHDKKAKEEIINRFAKYVIKLSAGIYIKGYEREDLIQEGYLSIIKAINQYNVNKKTFTAYVTRSVRNNYYNMIRKIAKSNYEESWDKLLQLGKGRDKFYTPYNLEEEYIEKEELQEIKNLINSLTEREKELVECISSGERGAIRKYARSHHIKYGTCYKRKYRLIAKLALELFQAL